MTSIGDGFKKTVLGNGFKVLSEFVPHVRSVTVGIWIPGGSTSDPPGLPGLTHFLEHMLFKGTRLRSAYEIAIALERVGGYLNAFTEKEFTCIHATVLDEHLPLAVEILSDLVLCPRFDSRDFEREKAVITEELYNLLDTPDDLIHDHFSASVFPGHPLGRSILGTLESLEKMSLNDIAAHWESRFYTRSPLISASGRLSHEDLVRQVESHFGQLPINSEPTFSCPSDDHQEINHGQVLHMPISQAHLCVGRRGPSYQDERRYPLIYLNTHLGAGMSSRLFQSVREESGLAYSIYSFLDFFSHNGMFGVYAGTSFDNVPIVVESIFAEFERCVRQGIPETSFQDIRSQIRGQLLLSMEDVPGRMARIAKTEIMTGDVPSYDSILKRILSVTPEDVSEMASTFLTPSEMIQVFIVAEDTGTNRSIPISSSSLSMPIPE